MPSSPTASTIPPRLVARRRKRASGWTSGIYETVHQLHLEKEVLFTEYVPDADICALMCGALAFVFPSIYEGFGMPPLEAMACGVPVLTTHAASLPEVVGEDAVVVDPYQVDAMRRRTGGGSIPMRRCGRS